MKDWSPQIQKSFLAKDRDAMQPHIRGFVDRAVTFTTCTDCGGSRLSEAARSSRIGGVNIADACAMQISDLAEWARGLADPSVAPLVARLQQNLDAFVEIGLGYLSLDRASGTLSGGEAQRIKILHLGSSLTDVTYVFDEPTAGLHPHDIERMNNLLLRLRDRGNTVLVVEHEPETIAIADHVIDLGPGAGASGGTVCFEGTVAGLRASGTLTGRHLDDRAALKSAVRKATGKLEIRGRRRTTCKASTSTSRSGCSLSSPASLARARAPWCTGRSPPVGGWWQLTRAPSGARAGETRLPTGAARPRPQRLRQGQRCEAGTVQRQFRGRLPQLQWHRCHLHRSGHDGRGRHHVRGV